MNAGSERSHPSTWLRLREEPVDADEAAVRRIVESTRFFRSDEADVAAELVRERRQRGLESGYLFLFADHVDGGGLAGYTCYGEIACSVGSYDLYWIAVDDALRGRGVGQWLLEETEKRIAARAGRRVYIETSGSELYAPTQGFYTRCGYRLEATLEDFYQPGDPKLIYVKAV